MYPAIHPSEWKLPGVFSKLIAVSLSVFLVSCVPQDRDYQALAAVAPTNPPEDAVVGMWHRRQDNGEASWRINMLFQRNGSGLVESYFNSSDILGMGEQTDYDKMGAFRWNYRGDGVWIITSVADPSRVDEIRVSGGKLLRLANRWAWESVPATFVYSRVEN